MAGSQGPRGATGATGATGPTGPTGPTGITGTAVLVPGLGVRVTAPQVTASSRIFLTVQVPVNPGTLYVSSVAPGINFGIKSTSATDGSTVAWQIIEP